jgi:hypothetical protein
MGNARHAQRRVGVKRKGPHARAEDYDAMRVGLRDGEAERQRKCRELQREREREARLLSTVEEESRGANEMSPRELLRVVSETVNFFMIQMRGCPDASSRLKIMELFLEDESVSLFLPQYYPRGQDAKVQFEFLKNYQHELQVVKSVHSADMLARKAVLLDAAVSTTVTSTKELSRVLQVHPSNLRVAISRRRTVRLAGTPFALARRKKRPGVPNEVKELVLKWWTEETRVSPNRKEIVQKWISRNVKEQHCTHYLLETQVNIQCY